MIPIPEILRAKDPELVDKVLRVVARRNALHVEAPWILIWDRLLRRAASMYQQTETFRAGRAAESAALVAFHFEDPEEDGSLPLRDFAAECCRIAQSTNRLGRSFDPSWWERGRR